MTTMQLFLAGMPRQRTSQVTGGGCRGPPLPHLCGSAVSQERKSSTTGSSTEGQAVQNTQCPPCRLFPAIMLHQSLTGSKQQIPASVHSVGWSLQNVSAGAGCTLNAHRFSVKAHPCNSAPQCNSTRSGLCHSRACCTRRSTLAAAQRMQAGPELVHCGHPGALLSRGLHIAGSMGLACWRWLLVGD